MGFYSRLSLYYSSSPLSICLSVSRSVSLSLFSLCSRVTVSSMFRGGVHGRSYRFPDLSPRPTSPTTWQPSIWNSPVTELISWIRARPLHSGLFEYYVRVHNGSGVGQAHRRVHHRSGVWNSWHRERRTASGHHRVHRRASAHHLLHHGFLLAAQVWKTNRSSVKRLKLIWTLKYRPIIDNTNTSSGIICKSKFGFATSVRYTLWYWVYYVLKTSKIEVIMIIITIKH